MRTLIAATLCLMAAACSSNSSPASKPSSSAPAAPSSTTAPTTGSSQPTDPPPSSTHAAAAAWDGTCRALLNRSDWYEITAARGAVTCTDTDGTVLAGASMTCHGKTLVDFAGNYWGRQGEPLRAGQIPSSAYEGC